VDTELLKRFSKRIMISSRTLENNTLLLKA
jgi:hypothetical protein